MHPRSCGLYQTHPWRGWQTCGFEVVSGTYQILKRATKSYSHVMRRKIQAYQTLEKDCPAGEARRQEDLTRISIGLTNFFRFNTHKKACGRASVRHHIQYGSKTGRLVEITSGIAVKRIE